VASEEGNVDDLRRAYEELARRVVSERLAFADRIQETTDDAQRALADRDRQIEQLQAEVDSLRQRVESLHDELQQAHRDYEGLEQSRSFRYTAPIRSFGSRLRKG
jgi:predicted  nucleic acid-binding Zn-ribbon protein